MRNITNPMEHWFEEGGNLGLRCPWPDDVPLILAALPFMASFSRSPHGSRWLEQIIKYVFQSTCRKKLKRKVGIIPWRTLPGSYTLFFFFCTFPIKRNLHTQNHPHPLIFTISQRYLSSDVTLIRKPDIIHLGAIQHGTGQGFWNLRSWGVLLCSTTRPFSYLFCFSHYALCLPFHHNPPLIHQQLLLSETSK